MRYGLVLLVGLLVVGYSELRGEPAVVAAPAADVDTDTKWCDLYISTEDVKDVLVVDQRGLYLEDVRQIYVWFQIGMKRPSVRLYRWTGLYKPSPDRIVSEIWDVRRIEMISPEEFQTVVDKVAALPAEEPAKDTESAADAEEAADAAFP